MHDNRLIRRLKRHDERAFRELVRAYQQPIFGFVYRMLANREETEDLAQEVFVTVFKSIGAFRGDCKLKTWIYRIAMNHCINRHKYLNRRHHQQTRSFDQLDDTATEHALRGSTVHAVVPGPEAMVEGLRLERALQGALSELDDQQRTLVVLRDIQGLTYQEIATVVELPEGTVKSKLHRARMALRKRLDNPR